MLFIIPLFFLFSFALGKGTTFCPASCPPCMRCDPWKGACILPRDFVNCTKNGVPGTCYAGTCNTALNLSPPVTKALGICQTYKCNSTNVCVPQNKQDGTDCTSTSQITKVPSVCIRGKCQQIVLGLTELPPFRNIGCTGLPNGVGCDTNDVLGDGETCIDGLCKFPDGSFYGYK